MVSILEYLLFLEHYHLLASVLQTGALILSLFC